MNIFVLLYNSGTDKEGIHSIELKGRGLASGDNIGDQYVEILVVIPADINDEEIALYTRLQELSLTDS